MATRLDWAKATRHASRAKALRLRYGQRRRSPALFGAKDTRLELLNQILSQRRQVYKLITVRAAAGRLASSIKAWPSHGLALLAATQGGATHHWRVLFLGPFGVAALEDSRLNASGLLQRAIDGSPEQRATAVGGMHA